MGETSYCIKCESVKLIKVQHFKQQSKRLYKERMPHTVYTFIFNENELASKYGAIIGKLWNRTKYVYFCLYGNGKALLLYIEGLHVCG